MDESLKRYINVIAIWEASRSMKNAKLTKTNVVKENRTSFFSHEENELIDFYSVQKSSAVQTLLSTFNGIKKES